MERSAVQYGLTKIPFAVQRSTRRKTVSLAVDAAGGLTVTAPAHVSLKRLDVVVKTKAPWILQRQKRASDRPPAPPRREFVTGETVLYLGRQYRLKVVSGAPRPAALKGRWLVVHGTSRTALRRAVIAWLRTQAERTLPDRLVALCARHDVATPTLRVVSQRARWGSCDARRILRINWRIVQAPLPLIDYVLLHELTHLEHRTHGAAFWGALGRRMPDYEERRERLRSVGPRLVW